MTELTFNEYPKNTKELIEYLNVAKESLDNLDELINLISFSDIENLQRYKFAYKILRNEGIFKYLELKNRLKYEWSFEPDKFQLRRMLLNYVINTISQITFFRYKVEPKAMKHLYLTLNPSESQEDIDVSTLYMYRSEIDMYRLFKILEEDLNKLNVKISESSLKIECFDPGLNLLKKIPTIPEDAEILHCYLKRCKLTSFEGYVSEVLTSLNNLTFYDTEEKYESDLYLKSHSSFKELFDLLSNILTVNEEFIDNTNTTCFGSKVE